MVLCLLPIGLSAQKVKTGIEMLREQNFKCLEGKRVGLITNPTGVDRNFVSSVDILHNAPNVNLVALFAPEHGLRGEFLAGDDINHSIDTKTGLNVYSLHGKLKKPTPEILEGIDVLVYDVQDIGIRSYTYISTMGLVMEAAAENNVEMVILDRPNPLGGHKFEGRPYIEPGLESLVSQFSISYLHGFTVGELATFLNEEGLLANKVKCKLSVVKMAKWKRSMKFEATGLPWVISSPHIPHATTPSYCAITGILGELYSMNTGIGYTVPFEVFAADWINAEELAKNLQALNVEGVKFRPMTYKPFYGAQSGKLQHGVQIYVTDFDKASLTLIQFYVLQECHNLWPDKDVFQLCDEARWNMFDKVCGTDKIRKTFTQTYTVDSIREIWNQDVDAFKKKAKKYFLYK
ncbi:hypothetical protein EZS27_010450 [termite gut metagenome]|uniref:DUF1343 domain-containing protein n=1 Tax=termite gut metagenome TaxID=433724 RepID=A0A5J4S8S8_9ZZZZ